MNIKFKCNQCGVIYKASERSRGKTGKCKYCGNIIQVPSRETLLENEKSIKNIRTHAKIATVLKIILIVYVGLITLAIAMVISMRLFNNP
jgi:DNA-directed RNA polymerase subunit RPC12/RpoP